jgi:large subunit ribosomal protein L32
MAKHPVPKKRTSRSSRDARRSHHALTPPTLVECPECKSKKRPHTVCPECGNYNGRVVVEA